MRQGAGLGDLPPALVRQRPFFLAAAGFVTVWVTVVFGCRATVAFETKRPVMALLWTFATILTPFPGSMVNKNREG